MKYKVEIMEVLTRTVEVEAEDPIDAQERIRERYRCGEIVLDADDFFSSSIVATAD